MAANLPTWILPYGTVARLGGIYEVRRTIERNWTVEEVQDFCEAWNGETNDVKKALMDGGEDADMHRETAQRAWLGDVGAPGGLSLFDGNGTRHADFAGQIAGEILEYKVTLQDGRTDYHWRTIGRKHDFGDAVTMCYALAGRFGISAGGFEPQKQKRRRKVYTGA